MIRYSLVALLLAVSCQSVRVPELARSLADFRARLERLRIDGHIQAMSAVIVKDQAIVWTGSFGGGDAAPVSDTTVFHLASLTKPLASTVILQMVDEGTVSLDDPVSKYGIMVANSEKVLVRHLLSHTSEGVPGSRYAYDGNRFSLLDSVIARAAGKSFAAAV